MLPFEVWLAELLPPEYLAYREILSQALEYFLSQLSGERQARLLQQQLQMPADCPCSQRLVALLRQCPTLHKLGQILARDPRLSGDLRQRLQSLESLVLSLEEIRVESFSWPADFDSVTPLAQGSVACVFACHRGEQALVSKRLKPGMAQILEEEFAIWQQLAEHLGEWCRRQGVGVFDYPSIIASLTHLLRDELHPEREQRHLLAAAERFLSQPSVQVPRIYAYPLENGLVMEKLEGVPLLEHPRAAELFPLAVQVLICDPFFSPEEEGVFHLDPHPGNLWVTAEGRLALLDWGSTLSLSKHRRVLLTHALLSAWRKDQQDWQFFASQLTGAEVGGCPASGSLSGLLDPDCWGQQMPVDLILLRKILFHLEGVEAHLGQSQLGWQMLIQAGARFLSELPMRMAAPAHWRGFSTHLSNLDILRHAVLKFFSSD